MRLYNKCVFLQPLSSARALHLTALLHQAGGSASGLDAAVVSYSRAAHALCRLGDVPHAEALLQCGTRLLAEHDASPAANVEFLLSKGHSSLISGKVGKNTEYWGLKHLVSRHHYF